MRGGRTRLDDYLVLATAQNGQPVARRLRIASALALPAVVCLVATWLPWYAAYAPSGGDAAGPLAQSGLLYYGVADWRLAIPAMAALSLTVVFAYALSGNRALLLRIARGLSAIDAVLMIVAMRSVPTGTLLTNFRIAVDYGAWIGLIAATVSAGLYTFLCAFHDARAKISERAQGG